MCVCLDNLVAVRTPLSKQPKQWCVIDDMLAMNLKHTLYRLF